MARRRHHSRAPRANRRGLTLVELLVVVVLIALGASAVVLGAGAISGAELKNAGLKVVGAARFAASRATTRGHTIRIRFDLDQGTMAIEEASGSVVMVAADDPENPEDGAAFVDPWAAAEARVEDTFKPSLGESPFQPIRGRDNIPIERYKQNALGRNVRIEQFVANHETEGTRSGEASMYFFPSGLATEAVVWLSRGDTTLSVVVHPLTARARIEAGSYELEALTEDAFDEDASELRDPS